jgi:hypothetical protein
MDRLKFDGVFPALMKKFRRAREWILGMGGYGEKK